jgi:hypothetical protein
MLLPNSNSIFSHNLEKYIQRGLASGLWHYKGTQSIPSHSSREHSLK